MGKPDNTRYVLISAKCPYYRMNAQRKIHCQPNEELQALHLVFATKERQKEWQDKYCCSNNWSRCKMCQLRGKSD